MWLFLRKAEERLEPAACPLAQPQSPAVCWTDSAVHCYSQLGAARRSGRWSRIKRNSPLPLKTRLPVPLPPTSSSTSSSGWPWEWCYRTAFRCLSSGYLCDLLGSLCSPSIPVAEKAGSGVHWPVSRQPMPFPSSVMLGRELSNDTVS